MTNKPALPGKYPPVEREEKQMRFDVERFARSLKHRNIHKNFQFKKKLETSES